MRLFTSPPAPAHACPVCDELREAVRRAEKQNARLTGALLRMKLAGGVAGPKPPKGGTPAADPIGVAIESVAAGYPSAERGALTRHLRQHATALRQQGKGADEIADAIRAGQAD